MGANPPGNAAGGAACVFARPPPVTTRADMTMIMISAGTGTPVHACRRERTVARENDGIRGSVLERECGLGPAG